MWPVLLRETCSLLSSMLLWPITGDPSSAESMSPTLKSSRQGEGGPGSAPGTHGCCDQVHQVDHHITSRRQDVSVLPATPPSAPLPDVTWLLFGESVGSTAVCSPPAPPCLSSRGSCPPKTLRPAPAAPACAVLAALLSFLPALCSPGGVHQIPDRSSPQELFLGVVTPDLRDPQTDRAIRWWERWCH